MTTQDTSVRERWFLGTSMRILADSGDSDGQMAVIEQRARRGFSPPLHIHHREDTAMIVLDGAITVVVGDHRREVTMGGFVWLPRDVPHTFRVDSDTVHLLELLTPAGFEQFHVQTSEPATAPGLPAASEPDIARLIDAIGRHDAEIIGPPLGADQ